MICYLYTFPNGKNTAELLKILSNSEHQEDIKDSASDTL